MSLAHANGSNGFRSNGYKLGIDGAALREENQTQKSHPQKHDFLESPNNYRPADSEPNTTGRAWKRRPNNAGAGNSKSKANHDNHLRALVDSDLNPRVIFRAVRDEAGRLIDFLFTEANGAACDYTRLTRQEIVNRRLLDLAPAAHATGLFDLLVRAIETAEVLDLEGILYPVETLGEERVLDIRAVPVGDELAYTWRDVTEQSQPATKQGKDGASSHHPVVLERRKNFGLSADAEAQVREFQALTRSLIELREQEHQVISRELHDNIAQVLSAASARIGLAQGEPLPVWLRQELLDLRDHLKAALADVRTLARGLRPSVFDHHGFAAALDKHAEAFRERTRMSLEVTIVPEAAGFLGNGDLTHLFRLTQEALQNIEEHSGATNAWVNLRDHDGAMQLEIGDDGCSFTPERVAEAQRDGHLGLLGMRERAELLGGTFLLEAVPGQGTVIRITIPPPPAKPASPTPLNNHHEANLSPHC